MDKLAFSTDEAPQDEKMSLDSTNFNPLPDPVIVDRAARAHFAMGDKSPGQEVLTDAFRSGQEPAIRQQTAIEANTEFQQDKLNHIKAMATKDAPVSETDVNGLMAMGTTPEANPNTVFEDKFAKGMVTAGVAGDPATNLVFQTAFAEHPERTREGMQIAQEQISRKHQAQGLLEEGEAAEKALPWLSGAGEGQTDKFSDLVHNTVTGGIYQYVVQRNLLNDSKSNSILPGSNKFEQIQYLYLLPHDEFLPTLRAAAGPGSDLWKTSPSAAIDFMRAATQFSTSDAYVDNAFGIMNVAGILPVGAAIKGAGAVVKGAKGVQTLDDFAKGVASANDVLLRSSKAPVVPVGKEAASAAQTAEDVLQGSAAPPKQGYYIPEAAVKRPWESQPRVGEVRVENGVPRVFTEDGAEVAVGRTPEVGHIPLEVTPGTPKTTFRTSRGSTYEVHEDGTTTRDRAPGKGNPESKTQQDTDPGGLQPRSEKTIYVTGEDLNHFAPFQEEGVGRRSLTQDAKGKWGVLQIDGQKAGKFVSKTIQATDQPAKGLYPVEISDNGDQVHFGNKITSVEQNTAPGVKFGDTIVSSEEMDTRRALADIVKSQANTDPEDVLAKMGQHEASAAVGAERVIDEKLTQNVKTGDPQAVRRRVPSNASPEIYYSDSTSLTRERADRLAQEAIQSSLELSQAASDPARVERLTKDALTRAIDIAKEQVRQKYNRVSDAIVDAKNYWDSGSNTHYVETRFGKRDGTMFDTRTQADHYRTFQYRLGDAATVQQEGNQFYLSHIQHVDETQTGVRDLLIVSGNETPRGWWNSLFASLTGKFLPLGSSIRSSASTLSPFQMSNRVVATHAPSIMKEAIEKVAEDINKLGRWTTNERHELGEILEQNRDFMHPNGERGKFYTSALEFETEFNARFGKLPTEKQVVAYEHFTRLSDLDWTLREFDALRDKARLGVRNYRVNWKGTDENGIPQSAKTEWFNGKLVKDFDNVNTQNANVYVMPEGKFTTKFDLKDASPESKAVQAKLKSGEYQIIQTYNPREKPLMGTTGVKADVHFVVVDKFEDKAVTFGENVPYRPGGHVIYQDQFYLKQPQIGTGPNGRPTHFGDTTMKSFSTQVEADRWAAKYNTAREFLRNGDQAGLDAYIAAGHLPETGPELRRMFADGTFSTEHPFVTTHAGRDTFQSSEALARQYPGLKDQFTSYNLSQTQGTDFLQDRGAQLNTVANLGTEANPIYNNVPSKLLDPYTALQKGMGQIVRSRWMSDYKISAAESWVQEFGHLFDQSKLPIEKLRQNPVYWVYHAEGNIDAGVMKTNPELVTAAMVARKNITNFLGSRDGTAALLEGLEKKLISKIESIGGHKLAQVAEERVLPAIQGVPEFARAAAFHSIIGLFSPVQLFQQAGGLTHIMALAPTHGLQATTASALMRMYRYTEDAAILDSAADKAAALGWNKAHFLEAVDSWKKAGVHNIGGETALLSSTADPQIFKTGAGAVLDKGLMFFKAGESIVRDTGWFAAYREWKAANPTRAVDNRAIGEIGERFQTLTMDMTRASNSSLNEGILSIPTQFWTWNARFAEQMLGGRLTMAEKARAFTMYSAMYGVPSTLGGITFGAIPMMNYEDIRQYALANGINVSSKWYQMFSGGVPEMLMNAITGHDSSLHRFGPDANQLRDIMDGKKSAVEMLGGASAGFAMNVAKTVWPALMYGYSAIKGDSGFPIKMNDFMNLAENVSSLNNLEKAVVGYNLGKYISKTEGLVDNKIDTFESILLGLGINPQRVNDAFTKNNYTKGLEGAQKSFEKKIMEDWTLSMKAGMRGDWQTMADYATRVHAWSAAGNFTKQQETEIFQRVWKGNESMVDAVDKKFREMNPNLQNIPALKQYFEKK